MTISEIKKEITDSVKKAFDLPSDFVFDLDLPPHPEMGDLSVSCFEIAKLLGNSPNKIAADLVDQVGPGRVIEKVENVGPYVNFFLKKDVWFKTVCEQILKQQENFAKLNIGQGKKVLIEYSAPNTNKPQHLGHLRNNFLGWALANLFIKAGFRVTKANLITDRGIHICKSMLAYKKWGEGKTPESEKIKGDHFVGKYYVLFEQRAKKNPELINEAREMLEKWEQGHAEVMALWQKMNKWTLQGFKKTYEKIGVDFDHIYYESDIYQLGKKIIFKALKKGLCYKREDNAIEIDLTKHGLDKKVLIRADSTSVYITQDIGLAKLKQKQFKPDTSIYVTGSEQDYHFKVLFRVLEIFRFDWVKNCFHLSYGLISLPEGKMKSREGKVVDADDIIMEMEQLAKSEILNRSPNLSPAEVSRRAEIIALACLKFYLLKFTPVQHIHFKPKESISFEGDTGAYVQYTYARIQSILKKAIGRSLTPDLEALDYSGLGNEQEVELLKLLFIYSDTLQRCINTHENMYNPAYLCQYLLKLSQKFNEFYHQHRVLQAKSDVKNARLILISSVAEVIKNGLNLLGVDVLQEM